MQIEYDHGANRHTLDGPRRALPVLIGERRVTSLLDVGCGRGEWLRAATEMGIDDVFGVDGVPISDEDLYVAPDRFRVANLDAELDLGRRFDFALCLEVGEHLEAASAPRLVRSLAAHADTVVFSAAIPQQGGQHHVNEQWPAYWQALFNDAGYACADTLRPQLWDDAGVEWWYRQNVFVAERADHAGTEPRLRALVHPDLFRQVTASHDRGALVRAIEQGGQPALWYARAALTSAAAKLKRALRG